MELSIYILEFSFPKNQDIGLNSYTILNTLYPTYTYILLFNFGSINNIINRYRNILLN